MVTQVPQHDSRLHIDEDTDEVDVVAYVEERLAEPAVVDGTRVFNFNSHDLDAHALINAELHREPATAFVVPYQVPGVWGFIHEVLPNDLSESPLLVYRESEKLYEVYRNYTTDVDTAAVRARLKEVRADG